MTDGEFTRELDGVSATAIADGLLNSKIMAERYQKIFSETQNDFFTQNEDRGESESDLRKSLGARIKIMRNLRGLTQSELAKRISTTQSIITNYETGRREPGVRHLLRIARVLNVSVDWLIGTPPLRPE